MALRIPFTDRCRKYGYIYWSRREDDSLRDLLGNRQEVDVLLGDVHLGLKRIDWGFRRISLGWSHTRSQPPSIAAFCLTLRRNGSLRVVCE